MSHADKSHTFDAAAFLKRALRSSHFSSTTHLELKKWELVALCDHAIAAFKADSTLPHVSPPCTVVGDIHGQLPDLVRMLHMRQNQKETRKKNDFPWSTQNWVFLGDYVDRGDYSVECISVVFALKVIYGKQYTLLRGNHETRAINHAYGFFDDLKIKLHDEKVGMEVWEKFNEAFSWMPLACLIGKKMLCMHGGISDALHSLDDIRNIKRPIVDVCTVKLAQDLLWADPMETNSLAAIDEHPKYLPNKVRGLSVSFNAAAVKDVCTRLKLQLIIRAHQMTPEGFKFFADKKLVTIFSAPRYMNETDNIGAVLRVSDKGRVHMTQMKNAKKVRIKMPEEEETRGITNVEIPKKKPDVASDKSASMPSPSPALSSKSASLPSSNSKSTSQMSSQSISKSSSGTSVTKKSGEVGKKSSEIVKKSSELVKKTEVVKKSSEKGTG